MMKKLCMLLAALMMLTMAVPAFAEEDGAELTALMIGDWVHGESDEYYLLFDGVDKFYYSTDESFYYGIYTYIGENSFQLIDDEGGERVLTVYDDLGDDLCLSLEGVDSYFYCRYRYLLMDFPNTDEGVWLNDDGETTLLLDMDGDFELENEELYYYGTYEYVGDGDYQFTDDEDNIRTLSRYTDGSISLDGFDGYFWLQDEVTGENPFEDAQEDEELLQELAATAFDRDPIPLGGVYYTNGDANATPFVLEEDTYSCEGCVFEHEIETGTWSLGETARSLSYDNTDTVTCISMVREDGMDSGWNPIPMAGNRLLVSETQDEYFLHESMLDTEEGAELCLMGELMNADWWCEENGMWLEFSSLGNALIVQYADEEGASVQEQAGTWMMNGATVTISLDAEGTMTFELPADSFVLEDLEFVSI